MHPNYFIGPRNAGLEIKHRRKEIMVITPQSPLGQTLMGRKAGQRRAAKIGGSTVKYHIVRFRDEPAASTNAKVARIA